MVQKPRQRPDIRVPGCSEHTCLPAFVLCIGLAAQRHGAFPVCSGLLDDAPGTGSGRHCSSAVCILELPADRPSSGPSLGQCEGDCPQDYWHTHCRRKMDGSPAAGWRRHCMLRPDGVFPKCFFGLPDAEIPFFVFPPGQTAAGFLADYLAILSMFVWIGYYGGNILRGHSGRKKVIE